MMERLDTATVNHIGPQVPPEELELRFGGDSKVNFVHVHHPSENRNPDDNLITLARRNPDIKASLVSLANLGLHLYVVRNGVSSLVRHRRIPTLWHRVTSGEITVDQSGIYHTLQHAEGSGEPRLVVVFSSIADKMYQAGLGRHFEPNFATIAKYIPRNTNVLRIVDFGSVVGSFYLNSNFLPHNEENIWQRIKTIAAEVQVATNNIVLCGTSKGGTAATFYALRHGLRAIAVDPILSDQHYIVRYGDSHFTEGTFPANKETRFAELVQDVHPSARLSMICSTRSPQYQYIESTMIERFKDRFLFLNTENTDIKDHPDVAKMSMSHMTSQLNLHLAGLDMAGGLHTVW